MSVGLIQGQDTLYHAVDEMTLWKGVKEPTMLQASRLRYPGFRDREYLAIHLIQYTLGALASDPTWAGDTGDRLASQFEAMFQKPLPRSLAGAPIFLCAKKR